MPVNPEADAVPRLPACRSSHRLKRVRPVGGFFIDSRDRRPEIHRHILCAAPFWPERCKAFCPPSRNRNPRFRLRSGIAWRRFWPGCVFSPTPRLFLESRRIFTPISRHSEKASFPSSGRSFWKAQNGRHFGVKQGGVD